ncbi:MAG: hypothetical protein RLZZ127_1642 [Planctomycetota bacterium]|jgi:hypothetical protein
MATITLSPRTIPVNEDYDVIVVGGGPAGCAAATAAGRSGARTLLIESSAALGGMGTGGLVPAWCPFTDRRRIIYGGIAEAVLRRGMARMPHLRAQAEAQRFDWVPIDPEALKLIYDDLVTGAGADVLFNALTTAVEHRDGTIDAVVVASKAGLAAYRARVFVDATGDGDVAAWAGAGFAKGDDQGALQPATLCFRIANVDMYAFQHCGTIQYGPFPKAEWRITRIVAEGRYPQIPDDHACNCVQGPGVIGFNAGHVWEVDNTDPISVSRGLIEGRRMAHAYRDAFAEYFPEAFAQGCLVQTAPMLGIRETRRIVGDYCLTVDDYRSCRHFADEIGRNAYAIDVHKSRGKNTAGIDNHLPDGESHGIPYRCLLPRGLRNLLVAGRCISTEREVNGSVRIMPACLVTGEAAGTAAAMACAHRGEVRAIDVQVLRDTLRRNGAYLPEP